MAPIRTSNLERGKWRNKCREQLAQHIQSRTGIVVEPLRVRLVPGPDDLYRWKVLPEKRYLFSKNMSDHSINAYKELCREIGICFEAVPVETAKIETGSEDIVEEIFTSAEPPQASFSAKIDELQNDNLRIGRELEQWKDQAVAESDLRHCLEHELKQSKATNQALQQELQKSTATAAHFRDNTYRHALVIRGIMELVEGLKTEAKSNEELCELFPLPEPQ
ncbi:hypothetical protein F5884DRAFT_863276 [Xylogone sp. PMI_703]|nr:hypothetical protein F5884DRAFT_863276 [Xylogone sp. PMI_703]